jgi:hypothetical protein
MDITKIRNLKLFQRNKNDERYQNFNETIGTEDLNTTDVYELGIPGIA